jgi:ribosome biogenesis GTPase A
VWTVPPRSAVALVATHTSHAQTGYPNTGKSALINRIVNRRRARTANTPGVTRSLQWIKIKGDTDFELLDSPGIIPASLDNQEYAKLLAVCNCIGAAAYDTQAMAAFCCERLLHGMTKQQSGLYAPDWHRSFQERYKVPPQGTGEDMLFAVANATCRGSPEDAARKILQDARTGRMGPICWEVAPTFGGQDDDDEDDDEIVPSDRRYRKDNDEAVAAARLERQRIGQQALEAAQDRGVELPTINDAKDVGKGLFDGW